MKVILPLTAAAMLLTAACSSQASNAPTTSPSISFQSGMPPGMSGMPAMSGMQAPPAPASGSTTPADSPPPQGGTSVNITDFKFDPPTLTVPVGTTVTWINKDEEPHTIAAKGGSFRSPGMDTNGTYSYKFTTAGSFDYICSIHPFMAGTVVVTQ